ncbi:SIR2 family protein [Salinarimonas soli]|uniref:P-loop NTPase n=1 Tax=Salinarimonas soli TaxID=1638099 RepID=UPI0016620C74|nr:SIR2 family protein [Salinarimonas soli]
MNIDDCLENAYKAFKVHQLHDPLTHLSEYIEPSDPARVHLIHVHGWSRKPEDGYVFSLPEYASTMGPSSPWITVLAHTLATEPFIIAGTTLEEPDLEYFLAGRQSGTVRRDRGPSFLVEPFPDAGTLRDCERHGLTLYHGTFEEFLNEAAALVPVRPLPVGAVTHLKEEMFSPMPKRRELALFSRDFAFVVPVQVPENADLGFYVGRPPSWTDISLNRDISREATSKLKGFVRGKFKNEQWTDNIVVLEDSAGAGKTTQAERTLYDLAAEGIAVFSYTATAMLDISLASSLFNRFKSPFVIFVDNFADHLSSIMTLYRAIHRPDFMIIGCERSYRMNHVAQIMAGTGFRRFSPAAFNAAEAADLIIKMDRYGLTSFAPSKLPNLAHDIASDPIALAVCRIMNDFRPAEEIVRSVFRDADIKRKERYLAASLAAYCYRSGISYNILAAAFGGDEMSRQFVARDVLPLTYSDSVERKYVVPMNPLLGQRVLREAVISDQGLVLEIYCAVGAHIAPYVNRSAVVKQTPEARVAGRLFDFDDVVTEMIPEQAETFYLRMKRHWEWNSRYWEQFALMKLDQSKKADPKNASNALSQALSHAKHAVRIERHPHPLTTLGKILLEDMSQNPGRASSAYKEAFEALDEAITREGKMSRIAIHPYMAIFSGTSSYLKGGGKLPRAITEKMRKHLDNAQSLFGYDSTILILAKDLTQRI